MSTSLEIKRTVVGEPSSAGSSSSSVACHQRYAASSSLKHRRPSHVRRADRKAVAIRLNDVGASLIDHGQCDGAIDVLRDSVEVLTAKKDGLHGGYSFEVAKAEARLSRAKRARKAKNNNGRKCKNKSSAAAIAGEEDERSGEGAFIYAKSIKMSSPLAPVVDKGASCSAVGASYIGSQGLLAVILYNLALAHNISGSKSGRQSLIDKASALYKMSESVLLKAQADSNSKSSAAGDEEDDDEDDPRDDDDDEDEDDDPRDSLMGVDVTYLARTIVNNMGMILFEWGKPDAGREYFDGLTSIFFDGDDDDDDDGSEGGSVRSRRRGSRWKAFEVNALIARGVNTSPAA